MGHGTIRAADLPTPHMDFLTNALVFLLAALIAVPISRRLGQSGVIGYLLAGLVIGPHGLRLVGEVEETLAFGEIGVVLLLFMIGAELQPRRLRTMRMLVFGMGTLQVVVSAGVIGVLLASVLGIGWVQAAVLAYALALSSTAFVLQLLAERKELTTRHGRAAFGVLLFQDISVVPALALLSLAIGSNEETSVAEAGVDVVLVIAGFLAARFALRPVFHVLARLGVEELFTAAALAIVIAAALAVEHVGVTMGLGAVLAGIIVADSEYRHQLQADINPFKGLLLGLFFMAVGMSLDVGRLIEEPGMLMLAVVALVVLKTLVLVPIARAFGHSRHDAVRAAVAVSQGGEFAFVLLAHAVTGGLLSSGLAERAVLVVTLSMITTPLLLRLVDRMMPRPEPAAAPPPRIEGEVVIAGFGRFGRIVARILSRHGIPYTALDTSADQIEESRRDGSHIYYGDPSKLELLRAAHLEGARALVIAVDDAESSLRIAELAKRHYPHVEVFARARDRHHVSKLQNLGVRHIMRDTILSSMEMSRMVLEALGSSPEQAREVVDLFRREDEASLERDHAAGQQTPHSIATWNSRARDRS